MSKERQEYNLKRTPVIAVMGHVDHGKTSLLDAIRDTSVQDSEVGGITQNTRAHEVVYKGNKITFIDTPGHEAFSGMRSRGAEVTDLVLLVVAADDGVKPQTKESIKFAKESKTPILVAINKTDLPAKDINKIKNELSQNDVLVEEYGGDVQVFEISATKKIGLDDLLEGILLQAEILELQEEKSEKGKAKAVVLESKLDNKLGSIALVLLKAGKVGVTDYMVDSSGVSRVRAVLNEHQQSIDIAEESMPVWLVGLNDTIPTGEIVYFTDNDKEAEIVLNERKSEKIVGVQVGGIETDEQENDDLTMLASLLAQEQEDEDIKKLNVVVKADTQGTLEVIMDEVNNLSNADVKVNVLSSGTGEITRKDILTAKNARGIVLGFQVTVPSDLTKIIQQERVLVRTYSVIYELIGELSDALDGMLEPEEYEEEVARAKVKQVFILTNGSRVAGCVVVSGNVIKGYKAWVERNGEEVGRGKITSLKQLKKEVKEMQKGSECGILIEPTVEIEQGDEIVLYKVVSN